MFLILSLDTGTGNDGENNSSTMLFKISLSCGSRMLIPDHGSQFLSIPDLGFKNNNKRGGEGKNYTLASFFCRHKFPKIVNILFLKRYPYRSVRNLSKLTKNYSIFYFKNCHKTLRNMGWGYGKTRSRIQVSKKHRIRDPQH
jgi:hypothetical protein